MTKPTNVIQGSKMPHIHTNPGEHDATVSALIVRTDAGEPKLLLHMHKKLGMLMQPGGHVELNETPWQAICHEVTEETGYSLDQLKLLQPTLRLKSLSGAVLHPQPIVHNTHNIDPAGKHKHSDLSYAFTTDAYPANLPNDGESTDFRWISLAELRLLSAAEIPGNVRQMGEFVLTDVMSTWEAVELSEFEGEPTKKEPGS